MTNTLVGNLSNSGVPAISQSQTRYLDPLSHAAHRSQSTMTTSTGFGSQSARLCSLDADRADLYGGPNVIVPPKYLMSPSGDGDFIAYVEKTKKHEEAVSSEEEYFQTDTPLSTPPMTISDDFALAFDIDGVLVRGGEAIPEAMEAMKYINGENPFGIKV